MRLELPVGSVLLFCLVACALESEPDGGNDTTGGMAGKAGSGAAGSNNQAGTGAGKGGSGSGGAPNAGTAGTGVQAGSGGTGVAGSGASGAPAGGTSSGGSGGTVAGSGGAGSGNAGSGGVAAAGGTGGSGGSGATGGSGQGGASGSGASGGSGGSPPVVSGLPLPPGEANKPRPSGTPGKPTVINWAGYKGAVTYTFDDANSSQISNYAQMQALGVPFTFFLWTGKQESSNAVWMTARDDGHELANHTQSHSSNGTTGDIDAAQQFIKDRFNVTAYTLAAPNGASVYTNLAKGRFMINRGVSNQIIQPNGNQDPFTLPTYIPPTGASTQNFNSEVDSARAAGGWRTMCIHGFTGGNDGAYQPVPFDNWKASVEYAKGLGDVWIGTLEDVGAYWLGQKAITNGQTMMQGSDITVTWTLPDNFPPGKYVRVTVPGGTLKQDGAEIPWHPAGFYEVALDPESLTVSP